MKVKCVREEMKKEAWFTWSQIHFSKEQRALGQHQWAKKRNELHHQPNIS